MAITCVSFDLDNTLWHTDPVIKKADHALLLWLAEHVPNFGVDFLNQRQPAVSHLLPIAPNTAEGAAPAAALVDYLAHLRSAVLKAQPEIAYSVSRVRQQMLHLGFGEAGISEAARHGLVERAFEHFVAARRQVTPFDEAVPMLSELNAQGLDCFALTNGNACIKTAGLDQHLSAQYTADDLGVMKPHRDSFLRAFEQHGVAAAEVIHVGDNLIDDIQGARSVGVPSIWVNLTGEAQPDDVLTLEQLPAQRAAEVSVMVTDLREIPAVVKALA